MYSSWPHIYATFIKCFEIKLSFHIVRSPERITSRLILVVYFSETLQWNFIITPTFWVTDPLDFSVDTCDTGCGGFYLGSYFHIELPNEFLHTLKNIISKELLAVLLACIIWKDQFTRKRLVINLDNSTVVAAIMVIQKTNFDNACLREIWFTSAMYNFEFYVYLEKQTFLVIDFLVGTYVSVNSNWVHPHRPTPWD